MNAHTDPIKVFADTNFLLDLTAKDRPQFVEANRLLAQVGYGSINMGLCTSSLKDFYYIARRWLDEQVMREWITFFLNGFTALDLSEGLCRSALKSDEPDFEDGIIRACAEEWDADFLLSRDVAHHAFQHSVVKTVDAAQLVALLGFE